jgi:uncharacterized protein YegP (UPF0339 family)
MSTPAYFYIYKDAANEWRWYFNAKNGKKIADSGESYKNLGDCENGIALIKTESPGSVTIGSDAFKAVRK